MTGPVRRLLRTACPMAPRLALAAVLGAAASLASIGLMATAAWLISRAAQQPPVLALTVAIVGVRAFGLGRGLFRYGERLAGHDAALRVLTDLRTRCYTRLERLTPAGVGRIRHGDLLHRLVSDVDAAVDVLVRVLLPYAAAVLAGLGAATLLGALLPAAAAVLVAGLIVVAVAAPALQHILSGRAASRAAPLRAELTAGTVHLLHGLPDLLAYGAVPHHLARLRATEDRLRRDASRAAATAGISGALVALASGGCVVAALCLATPRVRDGGLAGVLLAVVVLTPLAVFEAVAGLPTAAQQLGSARPALRRVFALLDRPDVVGEPAAPAPVPAAPYHLRVEAVSARWPSAEDDVGYQRADDRQVADRQTVHQPAADGLAVDGLAVDGVSFDLPPGRRVALVGPSGSGKSTVAALLVRFLDPVRGRITLGGVDLRTLDGDRVRAVISLVDADAHIFDTTIEANLRIGDPEATPRQLRAALRDARLLSWVDSLPDGIATTVGERGARLSGGQRRRLALARALLRDAPILVLDEPTEHLDEPTARHITDDLLAATRTRSVILITHRPHGLPQVDEIIHLRHRPAPPRR